MPAVVLVYYFSNRANAAGDCWPSWAQITEETGLGRSTIGKTIPILKKLGVLVAVSKVRQVHKYRLDFDKMVRDLAVTSLSGGLDENATGLAGGLVKSTAETGPVSLVDTEVPIDPVDPIITMTASGQSGEIMTKKENRKKDKAVSQPFAQTTLGQTKKQIQVTGVESLARWWKVMVHEQAETDEGIALDLKTKEKAMLWQVAKSLDYDWERILPMLEAVIVNWSTFRMQVKTDHEKKIGLRPHPGIVAKYLDTALDYWQLIATQPPVPVLQTAPIPLTVPVTPAAPITEVLTEQQKADVLDVLKGF